MSAVLALSNSLISRRSVTPEDAGCQDILRARLEACGFECETMVFGEVTNLLAVRAAEENGVVNGAENGADANHDEAPLLIFAGHTDVVPPGDESNWHSPPFEPAVRDGMLYGRGAADMKTAIAAMVVAVEAFVESFPDHAGRIGFLITSDEEGPAVDGTVRVVDVLKERGMIPDYCIVGEASSEKSLGDIIKHGRRGSLTGNLVVQGKQGHAAYPEKALNPIHAALPALNALQEVVWDAGNDDFPPTSFQIVNLNGGVGASNVIPGDITCQFNFRYSTETNADKLKAAVSELFDSFDMNYQIDWVHGARPFLTQPGKLIDAVVRAIESVVGRTPTLSTAGGTSDGRFIAPLGTEVVEVGVVNDSVHKVDENVSVADLETLVDVYKKILEELVC